MGAGLKPTPQQVEALVRLRATPEYKLFEEAVREYERELTERLVKVHDPVHVYQSQGGIEACRTIRELVDSAPETLRKMTGK